MTPKDLAPGLTGAASRTVVPADLASAYGNKGVDVLSSMTLMTLLEQAAIHAILDGLGPGEMTVGARMEFDHLAPTPAGFTVTAAAELVEVKGPKLVFSVSAHDGVEQVARGSHIRFRVPSEKFFAGLAAKSARGQKP